MPYKSLFKIVVSLLFVTYLFFKVDIRLVLGALASVKPAWYLLSLLVPIVNTIVLAQKYKIVMKPSGIYQSVLQLIRINFICRFYSMFLSAPVGQGLIRWHLSTKNQGGRVKFLAVMLFERSTFLFALCLACVISLMLAPNGKAHEITDKTYPFLLAALLGLLLFYAFLSCRPICQSVMTNLLALKVGARNNFVRRLSGLVGTFSIFCNKKTILVSSLFFAFAWQSLFILRMYFVMLSIQVSLSLVHLVWMVSLVLLLQVLPISLNGIGMRETAYAFCFEMLHLPPEKGVVAGLLCFTHMVIISAIGGLLHLLPKEECVSS